IKGEKPRFCCGEKGSRLGDVGPLPVLPSEFDIFLNDPDISTKSHILNLIFSFASMQTTAEFPGWHGPLFFFAIHGHVYHHLHPTATKSAVRWVLYDGFMHHHAAPHPGWMNTLPQGWLEPFKAALTHCNPFVQSLQQLASMDSVTYPNMSIYLERMV
ncbi:hypothetical protein JB92DRAFT_2779483, partial [Gautieria morchelliformis]